MGKEFSLESSQVYVVEFFLCCASFADQRSLLEGMCMNQDFMIILDKKENSTRLPLPTRKNIYISSVFCGSHKKHKQEGKKEKSGRKKGKIHKHKISIQTFLSCHSSYSFLPRKKSIKPRASSPKLNAYSINHFIQSIAASPSPFRS